uniref:Uncharacterized protein n=1 Tax=Romanomermis culicivorax TaxID=13658 RepID=A0A915KKQ6_ROMCU
MIHNDPYLRRIVTCAPLHKQHPVAGKAMIGKLTCKSTKWTTSCADNLHSNRVPQKERKDDDKSLLVFSYISLVSVPACCQVWREELLCNIRSLAKA